MSSIRRAPQGRPGWQARYRDPLGTERTRTFRYKADAQAWLAVNEVEVQRGEWIDPAGPQRLFGDWYREWQTTQVDLRPSTLARDESYGRTHVLPAFGAMRLGQIDHLTVQGWVAALSARGLAPATVHKVHQILGKVMSTAVDAQLVAHDPCVKIRLPKVERFEMRFLEPEGLARLAEAIDERYSAFVLLGGYGGLRAGEMLGLRRNRVDLLRARVEVAEIVVEVRGHHVVGPPKTSAGRRSVPLPRFVVDRLGEHLERSRTGPAALVFAAPEGGPVRLSHFRRRVWTPALRATGLEGLRVHDLRHTAVALWIAAGASPNEIARRAGHTSVSVVLDRYGHLLPGTEERVNDALDRMGRDARVETASVVPIRR